MYGTNGDSVEGLLQPYNFTLVLVWNILLSSKAGIAH